jgi:Spy/CpxP family protein refolding chaperone
MFRACSLALLSALLVLSAGSFGQDPKAKEDPKKSTDVKKDEPVGKLKGSLPKNWKKLGLTDTQVQEVYKVQAKYSDEIAKVQAKLDALKAARDKEERAVLTPEQKKRLEEILLGKDKDTEEKK